jgi:thioredoxin-related protein
MEKVKQQDIEVVKVIVDDESAADLVAKHSVRNIPTVVLVDSQEEEVARVLGVQPLDMYVSTYNQFNNQ